MTSLVAVDLDVLDLVPAVLIEGPEVGIHDDFPGGDDVVAAERVAVVELHPFPQV